MSTQTRRPAGALLLTLAGAALALAGCGKMGALERPGPMFGKTSANPAAERSAQTQDPSRPVSTVDPRDDRTTQISPPRTSPIEGTSPDPFGSRPQGVLPDPFANPNTTPNQ